MARAIIKQRLRNISKRRESRGEGNCPGDRVTFVGDGIADGDLCEGLGGLDAILPGQLCGRQA